MIDLIARLKLTILAHLLKWFHEEWFTQKDGEKWWALDTARGLVYMHRRDKWRRICKRS
jgi:hypothetical protein